MLLELDLDIAPGLGAPEAALPRRPRKQDGERKKEEQRSEYCPPQDICETLGQCFADFSAVPSERPIHSDASLVRDPNFGSIVQGECRTAQKQNPRLINDLAKDLEPRLVRRDLT